MLIKHFLETGPTSVLSNPRLKQLCSVPALPALLSSPRLLTCNECGRVSEPGATAGHSSTNNAKQCMTPPVSFVEIFFVSRTSAKTLTRANAGRAPQSQLVAQLGKFFRVGILYEVAAAEVVKNFFCVRIDRNVCPAYKGGLWLNDARPLRVWPAYHGFPCFAIRRVQVSKLKCILRRHPICPHLPADLEALLSDDCECREEQSRRRAPLPPEPNGVSQPRDKSSHNRLVPIKQAELHDSCELVGAGLCLGRRRVAGTRCAKRLRSLPCRE